MTNASTTRKRSASKEAATAPAKPRRNGARNLVIVESPAKARTIGSILGDDYKVIASLGHVRDLPNYGYGVEDFEGFLPKYQVLKEKAGVIKEIKDAAEAAENVYLSTDPDREGEAISWHVVEAAGIAPEKTSRVIFHEITKPAIDEAFAHPGKLNLELINAQQTRRVIDRLVGFPLTWYVQGKVTRNASAGRVQSVALRLIVEREREVQAFTPEEYWSIHARLAAGTAELEAQLSRLPGDRGKPSIGDDTHANRLLDEYRRSDFTVTSVKKGTRKQAPAPPFTTSTYQQAANNRLGIGAQRAMALAQQLYEGVTLPGEGAVGLITYMRTDSLNISPVARGEAREYVAGRWGKDYVPDKERVYRTRAKGAQEAHEAIRPTSPARSPQNLRGVLDAQQLRVYELIWQRFMASQMSDALYDTVAVDIEAREQGELRGTFRASARHLSFPGHLAVYGVHENDDRSPDDEESTVDTLPELTEGQLLDRRAVDGIQHFTEPPPRFTEASLVKALEEKGIGRPSTYASIVQTVQKRDYVKKEGRALVPQELGFIVNDLLVANMERYVAVPFTSELEGELDEIAEGDQDYLTVVKGIWEPFKAAIDRANEGTKKIQEETDFVCDVCNQAKMVIKWGRNGKFLACPRYPDCKNAKPLTEEGQPMDVAGPTATDYRCPRDGGVLIQKSGPFGPYVDCENRDKETCEFRAGLPIGIVCPEEPETGQLVEKRTRRGTFYGCWNYPYCSYTTNTLEPGKMSPVREPAEREEANKKLLERSARGKKAAATRKSNRTKKATTTRAAKSAS